MIANLETMRARLADPSTRQGACIELGDWMRDFCLLMGTEFETALLVGQAMTTGLYREWGFIVPMDRVRYPVDWEEIAISIKEANDWVCHACGRQCRKPGEAFDTHKRTLTVAHLYPPDHAPDAPIVFVAPLCAGCHLQEDARRRKEQSTYPPKRKKKANDANPNL